VNWFFVQESRQLATRRIPPLVVAFVLDGILSTYRSLAAMQVREAKLEDVDAIMGLVHRVVPQMRASGNLQWDDQYPNASVFERDVAKATLWVAEVDGHIAGVAAITTDQEPEYADVGWDISELAIVVHRLAVDPAFQGKGVAMALMLQAEAVGRARGIAVWRVDTNTQNEATQRLFPKLGYLLAGEIGLGFRPGLRFQCYEKRLLTKEEGAKRAPSSR
jgi:GNAT superfamily N-acetyltransferase